MQLSGKRFYETGEEQRLTHNSTHPSPTLQKTKPKGGHVPVGLYARAHLGGGFRGQERVCAERDGAGGAGRGHPRDLQGAGHLARARVPLRRWQVRRLRPDPRRAARPTRRQTRR